MTTELRTMIVAPGIEIKQEGNFPISPFGENSENPISAVGKELHIHTIKNKIFLALDNPISGGPFVVCSGDKQVVLIPGEQKVFDNKNLLILIRKTDCVQMIFINADKLFS